MSCARSKQEVEQKIGSIQRRLDAANRLTEREILAVGEHLSEILTETDGLHRDIEIIYQNIDGNEKESLNALMSRFTQVSIDLVHAFDQSSSQVSAYASRTSRVSTDMARILDLVRKIKVLAGNTRLLAFNARIEAARESSDEQSLAALASEMKLLSREITQSAKGIEKLGRALDAALPNIEETSRRLLRDYDARSSSLKQECSHLKEGHKHARNTCYSILQRSRSRGEQFKQLHYSVLSRLQFQDLVKNEIEPARGEIETLASAFGKVLDIIEEYGSEDLTELVKETISEELSEQELDAQAEFANRQHVMEGTIEFL